MARFKIAVEGSLARAKLLKGAEFLARCVGATLGPFGQNWLLEKDGGRVTNDGVTVARDLMLRDEIENQGLRAVREAAVKTNDQAGDGTTTSVVLANAILQSATQALGGVKVLVSKISPSELLKKLRSELTFVLAKLTEMSEKIVTKEQLISSALVAVEDEEMAKMIGETQWDLGPNGYILAKETAEKTSRVEKTKGVRIDNGFGTSLMMNNLEKQTLEVVSSPIVLTSYVVNDLLLLKRVVEQLAKMGKRKLVIVGRAFNEDAIRGAMESHRAGFQIFLINSPYTDMNEVFKDLAAVTGATFLASENSELSDIQLSDVGYCERVVSGRHYAIITGANDEKTQERVDVRLKELAEQLSGEKSDFMKKNISQRIAQLTNGFATIEVGGQSDIERKRLMDKVEDAVNAVRVALQEGVVPGAGLAFKKIADELPDGYLLKRPLYSVYEQISASAPSDWVVPDWVRDPVKVLRCALENAVSVAGNLATAAGVTAQERDKSLDEAFAKFRNLSEEDV